MTEVECKLDDFVGSGRTGRRNALPDILDPAHTKTATGGIAYDLEKLQCSESEKSDTACSKSEKQDSDNANTNGKPNS